MPALVTFLSDFGTDDVFVGLCHAVLSGRAPDARVVDLTHGVPRQDVATGAFRLADCVPFVAAAAARVEIVVHLAVVDPGVGTERRPVVLQAGRGSPATYLVGPDNGLLQPAATRLGGVRRAWHIAADPGASATFHGRDVFAPAAGALAAGTAAARIGTPLPVGELVPFAEPLATSRSGSLRAVVRDIDVYGNVQLAATATDLDDAGLAGASLRLSAGPLFSMVTRATNFAEVAPRELGLISDSFGWLAIVAGGGDAAGRLGTVRGETVEITHGGGPTDSEVEHAAG